MIIKARNDTMKSCGWRRMNVKDPERIEFWKKMAEYNPNSVKVIE